MKYMDNIQFSCFPHFSLEANNKQELYKLIKMHRLQSLFISDVSKCSICDNELLNQCKQDVEGYKANFNNVLSFLSNINKKYNNSVLAIKGCTSYALTGKDILFRYSGDIDLFAKDVSDLKKQLIDEGFNEVDCSCDDHEFCKMRHEQKNLFVEIHEYFPVLHIQNATKLDFSKITYNDLANNSSFVSIDDYSLPVINFEMAALITCAHIYKGFVWEPYNFPMFRLEELTEVYELCHDNHFHADKFTDLIKRFHAQDVVSFVRSLLSYYYSEESNPLSFIPDKFIPKYRINNGDISPWIPYNGKDFIKTITYGSAFNLVLSDNNNIINLSNTPYCSKNIKHVIRASSDTLQCDFFFSIKNVDNSLCITIALSNDKDRYYAAQVHFGNVSCINILYVTGERRTFGEGGESIIESNEQKHTITASFDKSDLSINDQKLDLLLSVTTNLDGSWAQTVIPIQLQI